MSIGKRLRDIILSKNSNLKEFSQNAKIPYTTLQQYLADDRKPGTDALIKISTQSHISIDWLLTGQGEKYRRKQPREQPNKKTTQFESEWFLNWLNEWWEKTDEEHRNWFSVQIKRCFPEYAEWLALKEKLDQEKSRH